MSSGSEADIQWLQSLARFGIKPGLERTSRVLSTLGHPHAQLKFYHVAGTNGKGSVCAFLTSILSTRQTVGTFTSPGFSGYRGRFVVNGDPIQEDEFQQLAHAVKKASECVANEDPLTEFEVLTIMAILYFHRRQVDAVVWETGLGGRYDSTNVVAPVVTAITNVGYDHVEILGPTIEDIAYDKAGIIKPNVPIVTAAKDAAYRVIAKIAADKKARLYELQRDFQLVRETYDVQQQRTFYRGLRQDIGGLYLSLFGAHQCENAAIALAMYELAVANGNCPKLTDDELRMALSHTKWPLRFEIFEMNHQYIVLDGAHNPDGARRMAIGLQEFAHLRAIPLQGWTLVIGILQDKEAQPMLQALLPYAKRVILTEPNHPRKVDKETLRQWIGTEWMDVSVTTERTVADALQAARCFSDPIACFGSLYTVDEARKTIATWTNKRM